MVIRQRRVKLKKIKTFSDHIELENPIDSELCIDLDSIKLFLYNIKMFEEMIKDGKSTLLYKFKPIADEGDTSYRFEILFRDNEFVLIDLKDIILINGQLFIHEDNIKFVEKENDVEKKNT